MSAEPTQERASRIATGCNFAAACCFFALASKADSGSVGYVVAGGLFLAATVVNFAKWRRRS
jgi:hypothetical protein